MKTNIARGGLAVIAFPLLGGCSLVFGNSIDFDAAKDQIRDKLNSEYQKLGVAVDSISCDQSESNLRQATALCAPRR